MGFGGARTPVFAAAGLGAGVAAGLVWYARRRGRAEA
jgi:LPXTG-motif cell wall-anchored protein